MDANLDALAVLERLRGEDRPATSEEQTTLARWSSWGALPQVFESHHPDWTKDTAKVRAALSAEQWDAAAATTLNAHYTDPRIAAAMWDVLTHAGVTSGTVLEPGCGAGIFMGLAPENISMVGVELDPVTAEVAAHLNPHAHVIANDLGKVRFSGEEPAFDSVIGNVPFGAFALVDPIDNPRGLSIHNAVIAKALTHTRPGGLVVVATSSFTMDAQRSAARRHLASLGELVGAVRLPTGAMRAAAGTDVVIDILVLRRREKALTTTPAWVETVALDDAGHRINAYFAANSGHVLGEVSWGTGMYGADTMVVTGPLGEDLARAVRARLVEAVDAAGIPAPAPGPTPGWFVPGLHAPDPELVGVKDGHVRATGSWFEAFDAATGQWAALRVPASRTGEVRALLRLRDLAVAAVATQSDGASLEERDAARAALRAAYDLYRATYGPINRHEERPGPAPRKDVQAVAIAAAEAEWRANLPEHFTDIQRAAEPVPADLAAAWRAAAAAPDGVIHARPHLTGLGGDPDMALVLALEVFDEETQVATRSAIFSRDIVAPTPERTSAESVDEALAISLDDTGRVDLDRVAGLLAVGQDEALTRLGALVFTDPATGELVPAETYLSGDVRTRLDEARAAAARDDRFAGNVAALEGVQPATIALADVALRPGGRWVGAPLHEAFATETFAVPVTVSLDQLGDTWRVEGPGRAGTSPQALLTFGTDDRTPVELLEATMNNRPVSVYRTVKENDGTERRVLDQVATTAARAKQEAIEAAFAAWCRADPACAAGLEDRYNRVFNAHVAPSWQRAGDRLSLPGLSAAITPHPHQRAAVARILASPATLLDHVVGAGKTGTMVMAAMELRRLGIATNPWVVVPNHLVEQVTREWRQWYPAATVLAVGAGSSPTERRAAIAKAATGGFDAVVCAASTFELMGLSSDRTATWLGQEIDALHEHLAETSTNERTYVKRIQRAIRQLEARHAKLVEGKDTGLTFEQSGCDFLFIDEAHQYKNLARTSQVADLSHSGSRKASDLDMKLRAIREVRAEQGHPGAPVVCLATGTPVANALAESWVIAHYARPDLLATAGLTTIDGWGRQFTKATARLELAPDSTTWRVKDRVSTYLNVPELVALNATFTDVVTRDAIAHRLPVLAGGARQVIARDASPQVRAYITDLARRANNLPADPSEDNLLKISSDGRMVALDPRLRGLPADDDGGRVAQVAGQIVSVHAATKDRVYPGPDGATQTRPGALQVVFCDKSVPGPGWNFYQALRDELAVLGMDAGAVRFIHEATDGAARAELFAACRDGRVSVLIGSTDKMGTGMNVQDRVVAIHHVDCPWRPADLEQREGRGIRQGNLNPEVQVFQYVTTGTYDAVTWQIVERKATFIAQLKAHGHSERTLEDTGSDLVVSAALAQAIATGDPKVLRRAELTERVTRLQALAASHLTERTTLRHERATLAAQAGDLEALLPALEAAAARVVDTTGDHFAYTTTDGTVLTSRADAGHALMQACAQARLSDAPVPAGTLGGLTLTARTRLDLLTAKPVVWVEAGHHTRRGVEFLADADPLGSIRRLEHTVASTPEAAALDAAALARLTARIVDIDHALTGPGFAHQDDLDAARAELADIDAALQMTDAAASTSTEQDLRLDAAAITTIYDKTDVLASDLVAGDVVTTADTGTRLWQVREITPDGALLVVADAGDDAPTRTEHYGRVTLVSRLHSAVEDPVARLALDLPPTDQVAVRAGEVQRGERITARLQPLRETVATDREGQVRRDRNGKPITTWVNDGEPALMTGTVTGFDEDANRYGYHSPRHWHLKTDTKALVVAVPHGAPVAIRHDVVDPAQLAADAARDQRLAATTPLAALLPGDIAHEVISLDTGRPYDPPTLICLDSPGRTPAWRRVVTEDGRPLQVEAARVGAGSVTVGRNATTEELQALYGTDYTEGTLTVTAKELRAGDQVIARDLDPKTRANALAMVRHVNPDSRTEITYTLGDTATEATCRRKDTTVIPVRSRRFGALTELEVRRLDCPDATVIETTSIREVPLGSSVWATSSDGRFDTSTTGTLHDFEVTRYQAYGRGTETVAAFTIDTGDGLVRIPVGYRGGDALVYPGAATPPPTIDRTGTDSPAPLLPDPDILTNANSKGTTSAKTVCSQVSLRNASSQRASIGF